ncbi:L-threonine aldolase [Reichenbachiella agariperforans]|uniref:L-threonine aldolase n=1 Tax=Reichenbachiella agariperforans TaxID=156994 RepID=A0A1M6UC95_REIAG|nr:GntG family PLP-dependent aldolase [Reichenbachiella agariperforans]SHK66809.1 L-threonine aldolase [Reichenbachiella agariperforans]
MIDLRSDTVTRPTPAMLEAMMTAEVGDDVFGEDPTVSALEQRLAGMFGKEAGIFCASGTMANQIAVKIHTQPGDQVICDSTSHIYHYEGGGAAFNAGVSLRMLEGDQGRFNAEQVRDNINADDIHFPKSTLISIENTSNKGGGSIWNLHEIKAIAQVAADHQINMHLDGARLFNALAVTDESPTEIGQLFDTLSICLSKGLGAPVGSVLLGSEKLIKQAKRVRKMLGGAMRQAGYLAAAGRYALAHHVDRIKEDHHRAATLAALFESKSYVDRVLYAGTNIVILQLNKETNEKALLEDWKAKGLLAVPFGKGHIRLVTHLDFSDDQLDQLSSIV